MIDCLASTGSGAVLPLLVLGLALVAAAAVAFVVAGRGQGRGGARTSALMLLLLLVGGGMLTIGGPVAPTRASDAGCSSPPPAPATTTAGPTPTGTPTPATPVIGADQPVTFTSGGVVYQASFRGPTDPTVSVPAAVIVVGTGDVDRDGTAPSLATEVYRWLADQLSAQGIASLRYDKLGTGSTGLGPFADDPEAMLGLGYDQLRVQPIRDALSFAAAQPGVDPGRILLLGHSEGGADSLIAATDPGDAPALAGLMLIEPAYTHILDIISRQFSVQIEAAVAGDAMTRSDATVLEDWMARGVEQIRVGTPPYPAPEPVPLPEATGMTAVFQDTIATNVFGSDPTQMVITHAFRTLYGKEYDSVDPQRLAPRVDVPTLITCGTQDFNTPCGDGTTGSGVAAVASGFAPGVAHFAVVPGMVHILRDVGSADVPTPAEQITYPFSTALQQQLGEFVSQFTEESAP